MIENQDTQLRPRRNYKKNWMFMGSVVLIFALIYLFFKRDFYLYVCEKENNAPACFVLSDIYNDDGDSSRSKKYLELSCQNKYEIACTKLDRRIPEPIVK